MKIKEPDDNKLYEMFSAMEKLPYPRDRAFKAKEIIKFIHEHYSQQFEIAFANKGQDMNLFLIIASVSLGINSLIMLLLFLWWIL